jgi:hypothetical protein
MEIRIRLPGLSPTSDMVLAPRMARAAVAHAQGLLVAQAAPPGASNECARDPDCVYLDSEYDDTGRKWLLYLCGETVSAYLA